MRRGAEALIEGLENQGVKIIFGYPGATNLEVYDALSRSKIKHVLTRSEQGAVHAASGYARVTGKPGVCFSTSGPGATNLVTGLATAYMDSVPIVAVTGQVPTDMVGTDAFQEVDITGITKPITKHNYLLTNVNNIPRIVKEAFHLAGTGRMGPVLIDLPKNLAAEECKKTEPKKMELAGYKPNYKGHPSQVKNASKLLNKNEKVIIYAGGGVISSGAEDNLLAFAEKINAPVTATLMGKGSFPCDHKLYLGMPGLHGRPAANLALTHADVIFTIGARFDDRVIVDVDKFASKAKIIHIDIDPAEIGKNVDIDWPIVGDINNVLAAILPLVENKERKEWWSKIREWEKLSYTLYPDDTDQLTGRSIIKKLSEITKGEARVTTDVGQHQMSTAQFYNVRRKRGFISSGGLGTMGYGLPAAIGAKIAEPSVPVVCVTGDGSFQMNMNELATACSQNLPIKVLLLNNGCLGMVRQAQHYYSNENYYAVDMIGNPNFKYIAKAYNMSYYSISYLDELENKLTQALADKNLTLIECFLSKEELIYPVVLSGKGIHEMIMDTDRRKY